MNIPDETIERAARALSRHIYRDPEMEGQMWAYLPSRNSNIAAAQVVLEAARVPELLSCLGYAIDYMIASRVRFCESCSLADGSVPHKDDRDHLADLDAKIAVYQSVLEGKE